MKNHTGILVATVCVFVLIALVLLDVPVVAMVIAGVFLMAGGAAIDTMQTVSGGGLGSLLSGMFLAKPNRSVGCAPGEQNTRNLDELRARLKSSDCNTAEHYRKMRSALADYGKHCFKMAMSEPAAGMDTGVFVGNNISTAAKPFNPFSRIVSGLMPVPYTEWLSDRATTCPEYKKWAADYFIAHNRPENDANWDKPEHAATASMSKNHRFLLLRDLEWAAFNALTFEPHHVPMLEDMRRCALRYADVEWAASQTDVGLYFHCWPHNSVNALHLHIVDLRHTGPAFDVHRHKNLPLDAVIEVLKS